MLLLVNLPQTPQIPSLTIPILPRAELALDKRLVERTLVKNPSVMSSRRSHVCVVGAGVSGLRCAEVLLQNGCQVTILEARDRIGGRVSLSQYIHRAICYWALRTDMSKRQAWIQSRHVSCYRRRPVAHLSKVYQRTKLDTYSRYTCQASNPCSDLECSPIQRAVSRSST